MGRSISRYVKLEYPRNLVLFILGHDLDVDNDELKARIEHVLRTLTERECLVMDTRFKEHKTLRQISEDLGVSHSRVQQIVSTAVRKLRHPLRSYAIIHGIHGVSNITSKTDLLSLEIENLDLSTGSFLALKRAGINTFGDLLKRFDYDDLIRIHHLGRNGICEIKTIGEHFMSNFKELLRDDIPLIEDTLAQMGSHGI